MSRNKLECLERKNTMRETNRSFDSCNSCKRLVSSRLHESHEPKFPFVSRIEFIRSNLSNLSAPVCGAAADLIGCRAGGAGGPHHDAAQSRRLGDPVHVGQQRHAGVAHYHGHDLSTQQPVQSSAVWQLYRVPALILDVVQNVGIQKIVTCRRNKSCVIQIPSSWLLSYSTLFVKSALI